MPYCYRVALTEKEIKQGNRLSVILEFNKLSKSLEKPQGTLLLTGYDPEGELKAYKRQYFYIETPSEAEPLVQRFVKKYGAVQCQLLYLGDTRVVAGKT